MATLSLPRDATLWDVWRRHADTRPDAEAIVHWSALGTPHRWTWSGVLARAAHFASALYAMGIERDHVCALVVRHHPDFYPLYMAVESLGAIPAVLAYPNPRLHPDKFRQGLSGMAKRSGLDWLLTEPALEPIVRPLAEEPGTTLRGILFPLEAPAASGVLPAPTHVQVDSDAPCLLQHSSGTTGLQKPVMLSHRAVLSHLENYGRAIALSPEDKIVSWLPLYHDMGLIAAFHLPLAFGLTAVHIDPFEWVGYPALFLQAVSAERGTLGWMPNFAFNVLADRVNEDDLEDVRLDSLRMLINCSEPVRADSHARFRERYAPLGFRAESLASCYAMAETTFAICQSAPGTAPKVFRASRAGLAAGKADPAAEGEEARDCVSSGILVPSCDLRVTTTAGEDLPDGEVGELLVRSESLFSGYRNNPVATQSVLVDGWYHTGDLGFRDGDEHYVIGRKKDILIVAGKNIYPEDVEDAVSGVAGILPGRVIACGVDDSSMGTEQIWVIAETAQPAGEHASLEVAVARAGMAIDVSISRVVLVEPRWLIKSSAGKPSRRANIERLADLVSSQQKGP